MIRDQHVTEPDCIRRYWRDETAVNKSLNMYFISTDGFKYHIFPNFLFRAEVYFKLQNGIHFRIQ